MIYRYKNVSTEVLWKKKNNTKRGDGFQQK